jgi:hypothetical protein
MGMESGKALKARRNEVGYWAITVELVFGIPML